MYDLEGSNDETVGHEFDPSFCQIYLQLNVCSGLVLFNATNNSSERHHHHTSDSFPNKVCNHPDLDVCPPALWARDRGRQRRTACPLLYRYCLIHTY
jgi:hypothetical protein